MKGLIIIQIELFMIQKCRFLVVPWIQGIKISNEKLKIIKSNSKSYSDILTQNYGDLSTRSSYAVTYV